MKTIRIHSYGHSDRIQIEEAPRPSVRPGETLVRIRAAGVNPVDWKIREGYLARFLPKSFPLTLGQDFSGERVDTGEAVYGFVDGSYAEYAVASEATIARKPAGIGFEAAAALPTPASTAYQVVAKVIAPARGQTVLIHGAAGAVGSLATQLCLGRRAKVVATASPKDFDYLAQLGVALAIDYRSERFEEKAGEVDAVIDLVGGETAARSIAFVKKGGIVASTVGPIDELACARRGVRGIQFLMEKSSADLAEIARLVDLGLLSVRVSRVLPLDDARDAQDLSQAGSSHGKVVLKVA